VNYASIPNHNNLNMSWKYYSSLVYFELEKLLSMQPHSFHFCIHPQLELMNFWMETLATLNKRFEILVENLQINESISLNYLLI